MNVPYTTILHLLGFYEVYMEIKRRGSDTWQLYMCGNSGFRISISQGKMTYFESALFIDHQIRFYSKLIIMEHFQP